MFWSWMATNRQIIGVLAMLGIGLLAEFFVGTTAL